MDEKRGECSVREHDGDGDGTMVIFDFDCTVVDVDSDPWVAQQLGASPLFHSLQPHLPWNDMMNVVMLALQKKGHTVNDVQEALRSIPIDLDTINAIKETHARGCELRIVSDANDFFIDTILQKHGVQHLFSRIHTNPSFIDEGRIHIGPYHKKQWRSHGCPLCPPNMCKGMVLDGIKEETQEESSNVRKRIIYLGDGIGDLCPVLRLGLEDCVLPRQGYPLSDLITENIQKVKASVYPWNNGSEMKEKLIPLIMHHN